MNSVMRVPRATARPQKPGRLQKWRSGTFGHQACDGQETPGKDKLLAQKRDHLPKKRMKGIGGGLKVAGKTKFGKPIQRTH